MTQNPKKQAPPFALQYVSRITNKTKIISDVQLLACYQRVEGVFFQLYLMWL